MTADTIVAVATPAGLGGIGVVRISGPAVPVIAKAILGNAPKPRYAELMSFRDTQGEVVDRGIALYFPAPHSYTGEPILELQGHGGPIVLDLLLQTVVQTGARLARPGEFSERAFINGKLDLAQAEAVADLIESGTEQAARGAMRSLQGEFSNRVEHLAEAVLRLRMFVEAAIDFAEEEIDFLADAQIAEQVSALRRETKTLLGTTQQASVLRDGLDIVIAGPPNAGKSSLLNALARDERAIVSPIPGTTRDTIEQRIQIDGLLVNIVDTAGLRDSDDSIESEGIRRTHAAVQRADRVLLLLDDSDFNADELYRLRQQLPEHTPVTLVYNKIDLSGRAAGIMMADEPESLAISVKTGAGMDVLRLHLKQAAGFDATVEAPFLARRRHLVALQQCQSHLNTAIANMQNGQAGELVAEDLRLAHLALGEITGRVTADDLLERIFSSFCVGK